MFVVGATARDKALGRAEALLRAMLAMIDTGEAAREAQLTPFAGSRIRNPLRVVALACDLALFTRRPWLMNQARSGPGQSLHLLDLPWTSARPSTTEVHWEAGRRTKIASRPTDDPSAKLWKFWRIWHLPWRRGNT
jgi:hypothetical protein